MKVLGPIMDIRKVIIGMVATFAGLIVLSSTEKPLLHLAGVVLGFIGVYVMLRGQQPRRF